MRVLRFGVAAAFAVAEAAAAVTLVLASHHDPDPWLIAAFAVVAGLTFVAAGLVALWRRPENATGAWMTATGCFWFVAALTESNDSWVWTAGFVLANLAFVSFAGLILAYPDGRLERRGGWLLLVGGIASVGGNLIVALIDEDPVSQCTSCPGSAIAVTDSRTAAEVVTVVCTIVIVAVLALIVATLVGRYRRATVTSRRTLTPVYSTCGAALVLLLASVVADQLSHVTFSILWVLFLLSFALVPISFLAGVLRSRFDRAAAARFLLSLDAGVPLRDAVAEALHDPTLEIVYRLGDREGWVDEQGREVDEPRPTADRAVTTIERNGRRVAALVHDPALAEEPDTIDLVASAAGLPLENTRLQADLRAEFQFLVTLVDTAPSLFVHLDLDGTILNQNFAAVEVAGEDDQEKIRGRKFWDVFVDPTRARPGHRPLRSRRPRLPGGGVREHLRQCARRAPRRLLARGADRRRARPHARDHRRRHRHHCAPRGGGGTRARAGVPQRDRKRGAEPALPDRREGRSRPQRLEQGVRADARGPAGGDGRHGLLGHLRRPRGRSAREGAGRPRGGGRDGPGPRPHVDH